jgi:hypothetical protein
MLEFLLAAPLGNRFSVGASSLRLPDFTPRRTPPATPGRRPRPLHSASPDPALPGHPSRHGRVRPGRRRPEAAPERLLAQQPRPRPRRPGLSPSRLEATTACPEGRPLQCAGKTLRALRGVFGPVQQWYGARGTLRTGAAGAGRAASTGRARSRPPGRAAPSARPAGGSPTPNRERERVRRSSWGRRSRRASLA